MKGSILISCIILIAIIILYIKEYKRKYKSQYVYDFIKTIYSITIKPVLLVVQDDNIIEKHLIISIEFKFINYLNKIKNKNKK